MNTQTHEYENTFYRMGRFLSGLLIGGLAGASAMLLLAPQSGEKTRAKIREESIEQRDQMVKTMEDTATQVRSKARGLKNDLYNQAEKLEQRGKNVINEQRNNLSKTLKDLGKTVKP